MYVKTSLKQKRGRELEKKPFSKSCLRDWLPILKLRECERESEKESECVCVCVLERKRKSSWGEKDRF